MTDLITIANDHLTAAINPHGAELTHLHDAAGRELMTNADPAYWTGHAPILFPVVGVVNEGVIRLDGKAYLMQKHGFARHSTFEVIAQTATSATFRLTDSEETRKAYPFAFALDIVFTLDGATLAIEAHIHNRTDAAMPASFGFHPAFAWPLPYGEPRADHRITFSADEPGTLKAISSDGQIAVDDRPSPVENRVIALRDDLFAKDALVWDPIHSDALTYGARTGPQLKIAFPDTPKLGIWTKPGAAYVCVEPWHGIADPEGYTGDYRDKPGVFEIPAGGVERIEMRVTLLATPI
ncbi:aldose 1-epimerase family protein [Sphingomonas sp. UV9]|uniref:aldose 1-epimerase family protein n=1 Tax=Sphingomonas sp. UV9 TaxID=1851410 RepID=UPI000FFC44D7|nr:aldose 1-epimerase family protein [Sphingomonas sp. UV9]RXD02445.1 aldose 1-epimerase family protein [Sphingomonas sp. UV9]